MKVLFLDVGRLLKTDERILEGIDAEIIPTITKRPDQDNTLIKVGFQKSSQS
jgi:hypothetical protein